MSTPPEFDVTVETTPAGVAVVRVVGELDMGTCERVASALSSSPAASRVVADLTRCTFVDSAGIRTLISAHRRALADGRQVDLVASDPNVLRVLEITGVDSIMTVHSTPETAL